MYVVCNYQSESLQPRFRRLAAPMTIRNFRYLALAEAISFLILIVFSVIKNTGGTEVGVSVMGPIAPRPRGSPAVFFT